MIPSPIRKVLSVMRSRRVRALLMGGQACVLYGGVEFSRDADLAIVTDPENLKRLRDAMTDLQASVVAVPPFEGRYLDAGHAVHFRCAQPDVAGLRVDLMARMRGVAPFDALWGRRTTLSLPAGAGPAVEVDVLALPDLVAAKKTQRDKDWPVIRRLLEASYADASEEPNAARVDFWLRELRTPELLVECARRFPEAATNIARTRPAVALALKDDARALEEALEVEQARERATDREYWAPLRAELERLRREGAT